MMHFVYLIIHVHGTSLGLDHDEGGPKMFHLRDDARGRAPVTGPTTCSATSSRDNLKIAFQGSCDNSMWGMEHLPIIIHAAHHAIDRGEKCLVVEAGAHKGALAILSAKLGCKVYAFEADATHVADMKSNLALNNIPEDSVHVFNKMIGDKPGSRVDEFVPKEKVTVLKMDIDGMDAVAMAGSLGLFQNGGVEVINIEFSPLKQKSASGISSQEYLKRLTDLGYTAYLADCYGQTNSALAALGMKCTNDNHVGNARKTGQWSETTSEETFFNCLLEGSKCTDRAVIEKNEVKPSDFAAFLEATQQLEVDLVLTKKAN